MTTLLALVFALVASFPSYSVEAKPKATVPFEQLEFSEFFTPSTSELTPSDKLLRLRGKRVRIVGFMAQMEDAPTGAFYLCSRPVKCDESGAGIGDLPVASVLVIAPAMKGKPIPFTPRALAVTGTLEVGNNGAAESALAPIRLILAAPAARHRSRNTKP